MKHLLITTIVAVLLVGFSVDIPEFKYKHTPRLEIG